MAMSVAGLALVVLAAGCVPSVQEAPPAHLEPVTPATWIGVLPCADCEGIDIVLLLRPDHRYLQRQSWLGRVSRDDRLVDVGRWRLTEDGQALLLIGGAGGARQFGFTENGGLRLLGRHGEALAAELLPGETGDAFETPFGWRGTYTHSGGEGHFRDCGSGLEVPVTIEAAASQLVRAYADSRSGAGAEVLFTLRGHLVERPGADGTGTREMLRVTAVERAWPEESCAPTQARPTAAGLEDTVWWLLELDGVSLPPFGPDSARLRLLPNNARIEVFGGCNAMFGSYRADSATLVVSELAMTRKQCPELDALEQRLLEVLALADTYSVGAGTLVLYGAGRPLARLVSVPP